jgi:hypothetical protein
MGPELIFGALSVVTGVIGSVQQAGAQAAAARYQAQVARNNAQIAQQNAEYAQQSGETQAQAQDLKNRAQLGAIGASQSASGLSFDSPSLVDVREGSGQVLRQDTQNVYQNAELKARDYAVQGTNFEADAGLADRKAKDASSSGTISAFGSLLSSSSSFAEKWQKFAPISSAGY